MKYPGSLHTHTDWSNLKVRDSINKVDDMINLAIELGHSCIAFTEHEILSGAIAIEKSYDKIKKTNPDFKVIRGKEIYLVRDGLTAENFNKDFDSYYHFVLLAKDAEGHRQIRELSTRAWMRSYVQNKQTRVPTYYNDIIEVIGSNPGHVIGSTACIGGALGRQILRAAAEPHYNFNDILEWCARMESIFGEGNFYLEMQPSKDEEQVEVNRAIRAISKMLNIPFIITNDAHYARPEDAKIHEAFLNSQDGDREVAKFYATTYLMTDEEVRGFMKDVISEEELEEAYKNINKIISMCEDFSLKKNLHIPRLLWKKEKPIAQETYWLRNIPMLHKFLSSEYEEDVILAKILMNKLEEDEQYQTFETYAEINACLSDTWESSEVNGARWSAYFLNLQTIVDTCWDAGSLVGCGRGSGVGFILLNMLEITQINPLREKTATFRWRFLNPARASVLDVDIDIESAKRQVVLDKFREIYGERQVANVLTIGLEKSKSAIITAARGLGIDVDEARYLSSLIVADRGQIRTLAQTYYGDPEQDFAPNATFRKEMDYNYPELWKVAQKIEGLISRAGIHAGGVIFTDQDFVDSASLMRAPSGEIITGLDLHDAEAVGLIKYDILSIEALDRIHVCLDLLEDNNYIEKGLTLKDKYESTIGVYKLEREAPEMWKMCWEHKIIDLFQMEKQSGIKGIALLKPTSVDDLAILNSAIRLMASEKGAEVPVEKLARFKADNTAWDKELAAWGLGFEARRILEPIVGISYGLCLAQEQFMELVQLPELGGFDLNWADRLRKSIAKKNPAEYEQLTKEYYDITLEKGCNQTLCRYAWEVLVAMSRGYGFNQSHTLAYSMVGLQEMNLAYKYPTIIWDTACIIASSGAIDAEAEASTNYTKLARAIGSIREQGIQVSLANVNRSQFGFIPDIENNQILFGLKAIQGIGDDIVLKIIENRPYTSVVDFINKVKPTKSVMIALIKGGAFDEMEDRKFLMAWYLWQVCEKKNRLTLQNMGALTTYNLIPQETEEQITAFKIYEFNRYLKAICKFNSTYYNLDVRAADFLASQGLEEMIVSQDDKYLIGVKTWDKVYQKWMDIFRNWIKSDYDNISNTLNTIIFKETWDKYASGTISSWEMEALCFYYHEHELANVNMDKYGLRTFASLPIEPEIDRSFTKNGKTINLYKLDKICGTCLAKDKAKATVTLLTTSGVATVKFRKEYFNMFDKQISEPQADGKKKDKERSWFKRGSLIVVMGMREEEEFFAKRYNSIPGHTLYKIDEILENGDLILRHERYKGVEEEDEN